MWARQSEARVKWGCVVKFPKPLLTIIEDHLFHLGCEDLPGLDWVVDVLRAWSVHVLAAAVPAGWGKGDGPAGSPWLPIPFGFHPRRWRTSRATGKSSVSFFLSFKDLLNLSHYFYFMFWFFGCEACGISAPWPGIKPAPPGLEGKVSTPGLPGESLYFL